MWRFIILYVSDAIFTSWSYYVCMHACRSFLLAIREYEPGDWRTISRKAVRTRTPMQVASHAQKYYERLKFNDELKLDDTKQKRRRKSIHDLTIEELEQLASEKKEHRDNAEIK